MESTKIASHVRSFSWPVEYHHRNSSVNDLLQRLGNSEAGPKSSSASFICHKLCDIKDLYQAISSMIQCPLSQQFLLIDKHRYQVEEALESSVALLDAYGSTIDILCLMRESILELESSLRRKSGAEENGISAYTLSRKKIQKMANKCLKNLHNVSSGLEKDDNHLVPVIRMLSEAHTISLAILRSVVSYLSSAKAKGTGRSLVSKLMHPISISCERQTETHELEKVNQELFGLEAKKVTRNAEMVHNLLKQLEGLELTVQEIEDCLESVSRCLLKTRVSLLNVLSH